MTISIPNDFEKFISEKVRAGGYSDPQEVVLKALAAMRDADIIDASDDRALREAIRLGILALAAGRSESWDPEAIKKNGRRIIEQRTNKQA